MFKQVVLLKRRPDLTHAEFRAYYEGQHAKLHEQLRAGDPAAAPRRQRYVRRYVTVERNPVTGEFVDPGIDCIMEIWWDTREAFEQAMTHIGSPAILPHVIADEEKLFATHANAVLSVEEVDSPLGDYL